MNLLLISVLFISTLSNLDFVQTIMEKTKFYKGFAMHPYSGMFYKRMAGWHFGPGPINSVQCAFNCLNEEDCKSVYVDGEACVFGVDYVTVFEEGERVTPDQSQVVRVKGRIF